MSLARTLRLIDQTAHMTARQRGIAVDTLWCLGAYQLGAWLRRTGWPL